ncbi:enoyl-CoA hydratase-related protein [Nocardia sp. AG03]|uniref:enoyl-CoA hydratase/isomerase family protein n=1 Tax=Nocardia sp. AG03 TaxID=3025312 RepID=UPI002418841A|nr:enoyl-CoA hydratase-related protein [Nocardia sp. AG03]
MSSTTESLPAPQLVDGVLRLTIATAAAGTSMDFDLINAGTAALRDLDPEVGAILLTGAGPNFCAGGNVRHFAAAEDRGAYLRELAGELHDFVRALDAAPVPVVAAVHGWAAGAGMSLVLGADVAIGGPSTKLRPAYPGIGLSPDGGMSWLLPRIVGASRAAEILLTDAVLDAEEAVRLGILSRLVADDEVGAEALRVAQSFVAGPRTTYAAMKKLLAQSPAATLDQQLDAERDGIAAAANGRIGQEGVDAFVAKRKPNYLGLG